jgi:hypothetical protein
VRSAGVAEGAGRFGAGTGEARHRQEAAEATLILAHKFNTT